MSENIGLSLSLKHLTYISGCPSLPPLYFCLCPSVCLPVFKISSNQLLGDLKIQRKPGRRDKKGGGERGEEGGGNGGRGKNESETKDETERDDNTHKTRK